MPKTPKEVLADPTFYQLPDAEQQKVLATLDPHFGALPMAERTKVLQMGKSRLGQSPADSAALHAKAGYATSQGAPAEEPGFFSRLAETTGVPTTKEQLQSMKPSMMEILGGPAVTAGKMVVNQAQNLSNRGQEAVRSIASAPEGQRGVAAASAIPKYLLEGELAPVGGHGVNQFAEDLGSGQLRAAGGDLTGTVLNLLALKGGNPKTVERLTAATDAMPKDIRRALPDLNAEVSSKGRPKTLDMLGDRIGEAEKKLNLEYSNAVGPHANSVFGTQSIANKILALIQPNMDMTARGRVAKSAIEDRALEFQKPWTLGKLDRERIDANNRMTAFYKKGEADQYGAAGSSVGTALDKVVADAIRDEVYPHVDQLIGKPTGYTRNLKQRIGSLMNMASDLKSHAETTEKQSLKAAGGAGKLPKIRGVVGESGMPRVYLSEPISGNDPYKIATKAAKGAFPNPAAQAARAAVVGTYPAREQDLAKERAQRLVQVLAGAAQ